jgi:hypothetical protein
MDRAQAGLAGAGHQAVGVVEEYRLRGLDAEAGAD